MTPLKIMTRRSLSLGVSQNEGSFHRDARRKSWGAVTSQATSYRKACSHAPHIWKPTKQLTKKPSRWPEQKTDYVSLRGGGWDDGRRENRHEQRLTRYVHLWNCYAKPAHLDTICVTNNNKRRVTRAGNFC